MWAPSNKQTKYLKMAFLVNAQSHICKNSNHQKLNIILHKYISIRRFTLTTFSLRLHIFMSFHLLQVFMQSFQVLIGFFYFANLPVMDLKYLAHDCKQNVILSVYWWLNWPLKNSPRQLYSAEYIISLVCLPASTYNLEISSWKTKCYIDFWCFHL